MKGTGNNSVCLQFCKDGLREMDSKQRTIFRIIKTKQNWKINSFFVELSLTFFDADTDRQLINKRPEIANCLCFVLIFHTSKPNLLSARKSREHF